MNLSQIEPFMTALRRVFDVAFQMNVETGLPPDRAHAPAHDDISAAVPLSGDLNAILVLGFPLPTAQRLVSLFAGREIHEQTPEIIADALAEIANMVAGNAKPHFNALDIRSAPPVVSLDHAPASAPTNQRLAVRCVSDCGEFTLEIVPPQPRAVVTTRIITEAIPR